MAETSDYTPSPAWKGHDFSSARAAYDAHVGRGYTDARTSTKTASDCVPLSLETPSPAPLVIACDVTGSMGAWPATIFSKLPYLEHESKYYLGDDAEISFAAIGDAPMNDRYPLQVRSFTKGADLADQLKALMIESGGGGDQCESYELAALYYARNVKMPNATKPIFVFIGDEGLHNVVEVAHARLAHISIQANAKTPDIIAELKRKFSVYVIRKRYDGTTDSKIHAQWVDLLGHDHVASLQAPERVVDVIFGILAKETGRIDDFRKEIEERQTPDQVDTVYKSLKTIHAIPENAATGKKKVAGKSIMGSLPAGTKTKKLID